jgi:beta-glucosidase/6-phospho-beta-glucosidase/beta-galactosidase
VNQPLFFSFLQAGFECSVHKLRNGRRLDMVHATRHDEFAVKDFLTVQRFGIRTVREGIRWPLIESKPSQYDFSSALHILRAAEETGTQIIWDILHFGWPDGLDVFSPEFITRFANLSREFTKVLVSESGGIPFLAPVNEISFVSWAGGDKGFLNPHEKNRGHELKRQLVRAAIESTEAIWSVTKKVRLVSPEPVIHIAPDLSMPGDVEAAERYRMSMFEAWDMISGRIFPELGGHPKYLDILGLNFYDRNEWIHFGRTLEPTDPNYRPFRQILDEVYRRYRRPMFVAETGAEDALRPDWFNYVASEVFAAIDAGVPIEGICLYPILNHPGWDNDRHCYNGLLDYANDNGDRNVYKPLAQAILRVNEKLEEDVKDELKKELV